MNGGKTFELITNGFTEKSGMRVLNAFPLGFRHFYTKKPVATIDDMKHLRMRVPNIPLYINFAKECGISGQPMPFAEVTGALDQGRYRRRRQPPVRYREHQDVRDHA